MPAVLDDPNVVAPPADPAADRRPISVVHPIWELAYAGTEGQMLRVLGCFDQREILSTIVVRGDQSEAPQSVPASIQVERCDSTRRSGFVLALADRIRRCRADVVHVRGLGMLLDAAVAARLAGSPPLVFSFHGVESPGQRIPRWRRPLLRAALNRCAARWAVSEAARRWIEGALDLPSGMFDVVTNGVDTTAFRPAPDRQRVRRELGLPIDRPIIVSVGRVKPVKGHSVLLEAVRRGGLGGDRALTVLVGATYDGRQLGELDPSAVKLAGRRADVRPWLQAADIFVLPSLWEGMSNALLEAMACGAAVVATNVGGNPELIHDGRTGLLVPPSDAAALALALRALLADPQRRAELGRAARASVEAGHRIETAAARTAGVYRRVAAMSDGIGGGS